MNVGNLRFPVFLTGVPSEMVAVIYHISFVHVCVCVCVCVCVVTNAGFHFLERKSSENRQMLTELTSKEENMLQ